MVDALTVSYAASLAFLLVGFVLGLILLADDVSDNDAGQFTWLLIIPGFAAVSYALMMFDVGTVTVEGDTVYLFRYIDWIVTTPILVGYAGYVAGAPRRWIVGVGLADAAMITVGLGATLTTGFASWIGFVVSAGFHLVLLGILYLVFPRYASRNPGRRRLFEILQNHVGLLWIAYPVVWFASTAGVGAVSVLGTGMIIAYLDAVAKTPYVYFVWRERAAFSEQEHATGTRERTDAPTAADTT
jgi:sensory rhodopsin